jgi:HlyD family secretion protein
MPNKIYQISLLVAGSIVLTGAGAGGATMLTHHSNSTAAADEHVEELAPGTVTARASRGAMRLSVNSTGKVVSNQDIEIKCKSAGEVIRLPYDVSDHVKKNELLMQIDPEDVQREVKQAEAALKSAQARLVSARQNLVLAQRAVVTDRARAEASIMELRARSNRARVKADRFKETMLKNVTSKEDYDAAEADALAALAVLHNAEVRVDEIESEKQALELKRQDIQLAESDVLAKTISREIAEQHVKETTITAPIDGVISARNVQTGTIISSAISNVGGGTAVMTLSDLSHIFVLASVDESDIGKVSLGQSAQITADSFPNLRFDGKVVRIATRGVNVSNVVTFEVKIEVTGENAKLLKPEMTSNVEVLVDQRQDVLRVPSDAVLRIQDVRRVQVVRGDGEIEDRTVETGVCDGAYTEITRGLKDGERVVVKKSEPDSRWNGNIVTPGRLVNAAQQN